MTKKETWICDVCGTESQNEMFFQPVGIDIEMSAQVPRTHFFYSDVCRKCREALADTISDFFERRKQ